MKNSGFTLIELLVVIAIIGMLSSIVFTSLNTARMKGRDARRISDLNEINTAILLYYDTFGFYPKCGGNNVVDGSDCLSLALKNNGFMTKVLIDPTYPTRWYQYYTDANGTVYGLRTLWFEGQPLARTHSYPSGTNCQNAQYPTCGWYSSCVYVVGSACTTMSRAYGSQ